MVHKRAVQTQSPVIQVVVSRAEPTADGVIKYEFKAVDGSDLPQWEAGAHLDVVVAPEFLRPYSMSGNPADRTTYQITVLREDEGRGGSALMHRIFQEGRRVFISKPINHFPLATDARKSLLMGGGIGITPLVAMAHSLHAQGRDFVMHYSGRTRKSMALRDDLARFAWVDKVHLHVSDEGSRLDPDRALAGYQPDWHVYTCGADRYMNAVIEAATRAGFPEDARHFEYFSVPEQPNYVNHEFTLKLAKSGRTFRVPADQTATDVLAANGVQVDVKCSDGICGVCKCGLLSGEVEHRDFVLSKSQRESAIILCRSRAAQAGGVIEFDL